LKNGSALLFPNRAFEVLQDNLRDIYFDSSIKDDYITNLEALELMKPTFSYLRFKKYNHPKMLFSMNIT
jgi:hypothetical protein